MAHQGLKYHGIYYFVPNMLKHFDTEAFISLIAPRPALYMNGDQDWGSPADGIHKIENVARPVYQMYGKESAFESTVYPGLGHVYTPEMWKRMLGFFERNL
jgi:hypothetical protein